MTEENEPRGRETHVRMQPRMLRVSRFIRSTTDSLRALLREAERRFLTLQSAADEGAPSAVLSGYLKILGNLRAIDERLQEAVVRRDISYHTERKLIFLSDHCRWLTRRVSTEMLLFLQVHLERELRNSVSPEAYQVFLRLEDVTDAAREIETLSDKDLMGKLRIGTLLRDILDEAGLEDARARAHQVGAAAGSSPE